MSTPKFQLSKEEEELCRSIANPLNVNDIPNRRSRPRTEPPRSEPIPAVSSPPPPPPPPQRAAVQPPAEPSDAGGTVLGSEIPPSAMQDDTDHKYEAPGDDFNIDATFADLNMSANTPPPPPSARSRSGIDIQEVKRVSEIELEQDLDREPWTRPTRRHVSIDDVPSQTNTPAPAGKQTELTMFMAMIQQQMQQNQQQQAQQQQHITLILQQLAENRQQELARARNEGRDEVKREEKQEKTSELSLQERERRHWQQIREDIGDHKGKDTKEYKVDQLFEEIERRLYDLQQKGTAIPAHLHLGARITITTEKEFLNMQRNAFLLEINRREDISLNQSETVTTISTITDVIELIVDIYRPGGYSVTGLSDEINQLMNEDDIRAALDRIAMQQGKAITSNPMGLIAKRVLKLFSKKIISQVKRKRLNDLGKIARQRGQEPQQHKSYHTPPERHQYTSDTIKTPEQPPTPAPAPVSTTPATPPVVVALPVTDEDEPMKGPSGGSQMGLNGEMSQLMDGVAQFGNRMSKQKEDTEERHRQSQQELDRRMKTAEDRVHKTLSKK